MIIAGINSKRLGTVNLAEGTCTACGAEGVALTVRQMFFHLFYIPMFPIGKVVEGKCPGCERKYAGKEFTGELGTAVAAARKAAPVSPVLFIGLIIVAVIALIALNLHI